MMLTIEDTQSLIVKLLESLATHEDEMALYLLTTYLSGNDDAKDGGDE